MLSALALRLLENISVESINSYTTAFGYPPEDLVNAEDLDEFAGMLMDAYRYNTWNDEAAQMNAMCAAIAGVHMPATDPEKAYILDQCFHYANETFYEFEDEDKEEGGDFDRYEAQQVFLDAVEKVLRGSC